jgi:hypothetical protein
MGASADQLITYDQGFKENPHKRPLELRHDSYNFESQISWQCSPNGRAVSAGAGAVPQKASEIAALLNSNPRTFHTVSSLQIPRGGVRFRIGQPNTEGSTAILNAKSTLAPGWPVAESGG